MDCGWNSSVAARDYLSCLSSQSPSSVVYVSLGSFSSVSTAQMDEIALGLQESNTRFLTGNGGAVVRAAEGNRDTRHIGFKVPLLKAFEIASVSIIVHELHIIERNKYNALNSSPFQNVVTVGRLPDKADIVLPVATVSGLHARLEKKEGNLLVTDLNSTNGTFVNEKQLMPGVAENTLPGSRITFGDTNLAMFLVSKIEIQGEAAFRSETPPTADNSLSAN